MLVRGQCRAKELRVVQVDGDGRLLGDALALQKVVAHLEPLVAPGHHGDVFGRLDGEVVFDADGTPDCSLPLFGVRDKASFIAASGRPASFR